jgi:uncharacterized protein YndB with AHSA1/START domain
VSRGFEAVKTVAIEASPERVWQALTDPDQVREYMHGTNLSTSWAVGSPISWSGEWKDKPYTDKGTVLDVVPERRLSYTHWSPMGGSDDRPENYHTVSFDLEPTGTSTKLTLTQDNNPTQAEADAMAENNWGPLLVGLKATAEGKPA